MAFKNSENRFEPSVLYSLAGMILSKLFYLIALIFLL